jgi:hypothetical protein
MAYVVFTERGTGKSVSVNSQKVSFVEDSPSEGTLIHMDQTYIIPVNEPYLETVSRLNNE